MSNFEELKRAEKGGSIKRFIFRQLQVNLVCVAFIFITYDYGLQYVFIFISNGINGILFGLMQVYIYFSI